MKTLVLIATLVLSIYNVSSQNMSIGKLQKIINTIGDDIKTENGKWQFKIDQIIFIVVTDSTKNRMRIISPITETLKLNDNVLKNALIANFHSALDVKYAISDGIMWSVFIHPLKELTGDQVKDAISQVYYSNTNFGTTYASTSLIFPGTKRKLTPPKKETSKIKRI